MRKSRSGIADSESEWSPSVCSFLNGVNDAVHSVSEFLFSNNWKQEKGNTKRIVSIAGQESEKSEYERELSCQPASSGAKVKEACCCRQTQQILSTTASPGCNCNDAVPIDMCSTNGAAITGTEQVLKDGENVGTRICFRNCKSLVIYRDEDSNAIRIEFEGSQCQSGRKRKAETHSKSKSRRKCGPPKPKRRRCNKRKPKLPKARKRRRNRRKPNCARKTRSKSKSKPRSRRGKSRSKSK